MVAPVDLDVEIHKDASKVRVTGRCLDDAAVGRAAGASSRSISRSTLHSMPCSCRRLRMRAGTNRKSPTRTSAFRSTRTTRSTSAELMREQFYLALPMKPLCQPDCKGLCPVCGINRNRETCTCQAEWTDPRFDALKRFDRQPVAFRTKMSQMPNPKRRHSKTRTAKRRTHDALKPIGTSECPQCHELKLPHVVCKNCGYYRGRQVRAVEEE